MEEVIFAKGERFLAKLMRKKTMATESWKKAKLLKRMINYGLIKLSAFIKRPKVLGLPFT